jgi:hypothetical protein
VKHYTYAIVITSFFLFFTSSSAGVIKELHKELDAKACKISSHAKDLESEIRSLLNQYWKSYFPEFKVFKRKTIKRKLLEYLVFCYENGLRPDLSNLDFSGFNLSNIDFSNSNLSGTSFVNSKINRSIFTNANLTKASFSGVEAKNASFYQVIAHKTFFMRTNLTNALFINATIIDCEFRGASLDGNISFARAHIEHSYFKGASRNGQAIEQEDIERTQPKIFRRNLF